MAYSMIRVYMLRCSRSNTTLVFYTMVPGIHCSLKFVFAVYSHFSNLKEITNGRFEALDTNVDCMFYRDKNAISVKTFNYIPLLQSSTRSNSCIVRVPANQEKGYECLNCKKRRNTNM